MIHAEKLQIGDWVKYTNPPYIQVASITKKKIGYHIKPNESRMHYVRLCEVEPIPITAELLEKNGFSERTDVNGYTIYQHSVYAGDGYCIIGVRDYDSSVGEWGIEVITYDKFRDAGQKVALERDFYNVHHLQHVLRLCGINKTIEP